MGQLEVSRSIGDGQYKNHGVVCTPDIKKLTLTEHDRYAIIACDGLWKAFDNKQVLDYIDEELKKVAQVHLCFAFYPLTNVHFQKHYEPSLTTVQRSANTPEWVADDEQWSTRWGQVCMCFH